LRNKCDERNGRLVPPYRWCAQWLVRRDGLKMDEDEDDSTEAPFNATELERYNHQNIEPFEADLPPPGCSILSQGGGSGSYQNMILFPEGKLAFCGIPKVGITQWIQFLRFTFGARDYRAHPHSKRDQRLLRFDSMREEVQFEILNDPEWKFAVFFRDPEERLLSAYLDKVRPNSDNDDEVANHFKSEFNFTESPTFSEFVEAIATNRTRCPTGRGSGRDKLYGADWCEQYIFAADASSRFRANSYANSFCDANLFSFVIQVPIPIGDPKPCHAESANFSRAYPTSVP